MNKLTVTLVLSLIVTAVSAFGYEPTAGFIDSRQALLLHPLFRQFDPHTRRFLETPSAWVGNPAKAREEYQIKAQAMEKQMQDLDRRLQLIAKEPNLQARKQAMDKIFSAKSELKLRLSELKKASEATNVYGNYLLGPITSNESLIPILQQILGDLYTAFRQLSLNHRNLPIFDIAAFGSTVDRQVCNRSVLYSNYHFALYGPNVDPVALRNWLYQLRLYLRDRDGQRFAHPFLFGFKDLRNDALKNLSFGTR